MKPLFSLLFFFTFYQANAEYNGWFIQFSIVTKANTTLVGHLYVASAYFDIDSIKNQDYLLTHINADEAPTDNQISFFKHRLKYNYYSYGNTEKTAIYSLMDPTKFPISSIKSIEIIEMIDHGYLLNLTSNHTLKDTVWMQEEPIETVHFAGYFCDWQIFVHQGSSQTTKVIEVINVITENYTDSLVQLEAIIANSDEDEKAKAIAELNLLQENIDTKISSLLQQLNNEKVVVITFCSC